MSAESDQHAWVDWCSVNELDPWPADHLIADAQLADWLFLNHRDRGNGFGRLKALGGAVAAGFVDRGLDDPRGANVKALRSSVAETAGTRTETHKVDALTYEDIQTAVVAGLLDSASPTVPTLKRSLAIELGHTHGVPTSELVELRGDQLGPDWVTIGDAQLAVETDLGPLRDLGRVFGTTTNITTLFEPLTARVCFEIATEAHIGAGLSDAQARWARFGASSNGVAALMWTAYVLCGNAWALRHNDLARMDISSVSERPDGVGFTIFGGKTAGEGTSRNFEIGHDHQPGRVCAACMLWSWAQWCRVGEGRFAGPLWVSREGAHSQDNKAVSLQAATGALRRAVSHTALAQRRISTRSLRVGTSTEMAASGASLAQIMEVTGHRSVGEAVRYVRLLSPRFQPHLDI